MDNNGKNANGDFALVEMRSLEMEMQFPSVWHFTDMESALDALREIMRETVEEETEGLSDDECDIDAILDDILDAGFVYSEHYGDVNAIHRYGRWTWSIGETEIMWTISEFSQKPSSL